MRPSRDLHIIVAMTTSRLIGAGDSLPWDLPEDLRLFRRLTLGQAVIMGRRTFAGIGGPLPGRLNIVIASQGFPGPGVESFPTFAAGLLRAGETGRDIFCIGGREIYRAALPLATHLHISWIEGEFEGDTFFPEFSLDDWKETGREQYAGFTHVSYRRKKGQNSILSP